MSGLPPYRRFLKRFHPEAIPGLGAWAYNRVSQSRVFQAQYELAAEDIVAKRSEGALLDIGTGPGRLLITLRDRSPAMQLSGVDISPAMVAKAEANLRAAGVANEIAIREGSATSLPFDTHSFDLVVSTGSFHHWKEPMEGLDETYRVLRPDGIGLIYDLVADTPKLVLEHARRIHGRFATTFFWLHGFEEPFYTERAYRELGESSQFGEAITRWVGLLCCLELNKGS